MESMPKDMKQKMLKCGAEVKKMKMPSGMEKKSNEMMNKGSQNKKSKY